ncbi:hypothetical protein E6O75_ATG02373 [Venturia nashicola]|uniref:Uncharacterized protein n=1 Tax=Venturia nashicola TaxID=86259 RepID=A0A4Z1P7W6_9PEZI|nr:hypothetical protein E6O75_ATG02373 [Venturia nashicola]
MPAQRTCFGRPITLQMPPRRFQVLFALLAFLATLITILNTHSIEVPPAVSAVTDRLPQSLKDPSLPRIPNAFNPFAPAAHKPAIQSNSSTGDARWYSDWRWKNPFSSQVTLEEGRAMLPPLRKRTDVYTFYEVSPQAKKTKSVRIAEERLLLQWRRAWWAQGFRPTVLGRAEAINNPLYRKVQLLGLQDNIEIEVLRWLAWGNMGDGVLSNWLAFPMAAYDNNLLSFLRRGSFPSLTRYQGLESAIFCGEKKAINEAIEKVIKKPDELKKVTSLADPVFDELELFTIDKKHDGVAYYSTEIIKEKYKVVADNLFSTESVNQAKGWRLLGELINAHLQTTWQGVFDKGIAVLKPLPQHMTVLTTSAMEIAGNLTQCPINPIPTACPPNKHKCKNCVDSVPLGIRTPANFNNRTGLFNIGSVPHPFTTTALTNGRDTLDSSFVRRLGMKDGRDMWVTAITKDLQGSAVSASKRASRLKEAIAGDWGIWHSLWLTAETEYHEDLDWIFGFAIPRNGTSDGKSETPVPGPERRPKPPKPEGPVLSPEELDLDRSRLMKLRETIGSKLRHQILLKETVEAWNLADMEIWMFTRAYSARRKMERRKWEEVEGRYAGAEGKRGGWGRWFDRR